MRTNYIRHLANTLKGVGLFGEGGGGGNSQLNWLTCCKRQKKCSNFAVADRHHTVLEVMDGQAIYYSKFNFFDKIIETNFYIYLKYMTYHIIP